MQKNKFDDSATYEEKVVAYFGIFHILGRSTSRGFYVRNRYWILVPKQVRMVSFSVR